MKGLMAFYALIAAFVHAEDDSLSEVGALVLPWCTNSTELGTQLGMAKAMEMIRNDPLYLGWKNIGAEERRCWTTPMIHDSEQVKFAKAQIERCMDDLAPSEPDWYTSFGLVRDYNVPRTACADDSACMSVNALLFDGTLEEVGEECGGLDLFWEMASRPQAKTTMQLTIDCWTNKPKGCWGTLETGEEIACPVYGPTYKGNLLFAYFFGGIERVAKMPKCRMPLDLLDEVIKGFWE